jgi:hypothetical protein
MSPRENPKLAIVATKLFGDGYYECKNSGHIGALNRVVCLARRLKLRGGVDAWRSPLAFRCQGQGSVVSLEDHPLRLLTVTTTNREHGRTSQPDLPSLRETDVQAAEPCGCTTFIESTQATRKPCKTSSCAWWSLYEVLY